MPHLFNENLSEDDVSTFNESLICTWHLDRLHIAIKIKKDFEVNILLRLQICLDNGLNMNKLFKDLKVRVWFTKLMRLKVRRNKLLLYWFLTKDIKCSSLQDDYDDILRNFTICFDCDNQEFLGNLEWFEFINVNDIMS